MHFNMALICCRDRRERSVALPGRFTHLVTLEVDCFSNRNRRERNAVLTTGCGPRGQGTTAAFLNGSAINNAPSVLCFIGIVQVLDGIPRPPYTHGFTPSTLEGKT